MPSPDEIQRAYHDKVEAAIKAHETGVASANEKLVKDLEKAGSPSEKQEILDRFDEKIAPVRDQYHSSVQEADSARHAALEASG